MTDLDVSGLHNLRSQNSNHALYFLGISFAFAVDKKEKEINLGSVLLPGSCCV